MASYVKSGLAVALLAAVAATSAGAYRYFSDSAQRPLARIDADGIVGMSGKREAFDGVRAGSRTEASLAAAREFGSRTPALRSTEGPVAARPGARVLAPEVSFPYSEEFNRGSGVSTPAKAADPEVANSRGTYLVLFTEAPLATYKGGVAGLPATKRAGSDGRRRIDPKSAESRNYVGYLQQRQRQMERQIQGFAKRGLEVRLRMQHAVNGIVVDLTAAEAARAAKLPGVQLVEAYREYPIDTDVGPTLIGAPIVWAGSDPFGAPSVQGEGMVAGILDSGINFGSPSFAGTDPVDGYNHVNPLGSGNYLGTCQAGGVDEGRCNDKLIGGYDFVCGAPGNTCGVANIREEPGFGDTNSHGSHTASTTAGNRRDVNYAGADVRISGVAPRANVIAYDICYTNTSTGQGLCPNVSSVAAVNQVIADGIVDAINYSIGGGSSPWTEATSLAFLNAVDAGVYVASSAGNSGPGPNTLGHLEPWVSATAAAQHGRGGFAFLMQVTGPSPVPPELAPVILTTGTGGVTLNASLPGTTPLLASATFNANDDGCAAYAANTFAGAIAVVRRGTCSFAIKANNASAAGAVAVIIANNQAGALIPSVPGTTVPVFSVTQADGLLLRDFSFANPTATAQIGFPAVGLPNVPDALGSFSSRGPAGNFNLVKPDVTAPGVSILAAVAGTTLTGSENAVDLLNGTSMASPHNAGSALLVRQARPGWTASEVKSALALTATREVLLEDQVTPANPFARGSGRIRVDRAVKAGLVMDESVANYLAANPGASGDVTTLNIPSLANANCYPECTFTRTFRNPQASSSLWLVEIDDLAGDTSTSLLWVPSGASKSIDITIDGTAVAADGQFNFGTVRLTKMQTGGQTDAAAELSMPIAIAVQPPVLTVPALVSASVAEGGSTSANFDVGNAGGADLDYAAGTSGSAVTTAYEASSTGISSGFRNIIYTDPATAGSAGQFAADDITLAQDTDITSISTQGFVVSGVALVSAASQITWSIYPDAAGVPAGNPYNGQAAAVWTYTASPVSPGVTIDASNTMKLDLAAAGQAVSLPAGKYWIVANTTGTFANRWAHFASNTGNGGFATLTLSTTGVGNWAVANSFNGLTMTVTGAVACGAPWLGAVTPPTGIVASGGVVASSVALDATSLPADSYRAFLCFTSNDPARPAAAMPVEFTVNP